MSSNTKINKDMSLSFVKDSIIQLIIQITGENANTLQKMKQDDLLQYLSELLKCSKQDIEALLDKHDQNKQDDPQTLAMLWKLVHKGIVKSKRHTFGSIPEESYNQLKFIMAQLGDLTRFRTENGLSPQRLPGTEATSSSTKKNPVIVNNSFFSNFQQRDMLSNQPTNLNVAPTSIKS